MYKNSKISNQSKKHPKNTKNNNQNDNHIQTKLVDDGGPELGVSIVWVTLVDRELVSPINDAFDKPDAAQTFLLLLRFLFLKFQKNFV